MEAVDDLIGIARRVEPRAELASRYNEFYKSYRALYEGLAPVYRKLYEVK
jgi:sugar (pentulose or hexulose) kinase